MPGRGVNDRSRSFISVGSMLVVLLQEFVRGSWPEELSVSKCCCFVSLPKCPSLLSQQTHHHQPGHLLLSVPQLCPTRMGTVVFGAFPC